MALTNKQLIAALKRTTERLAKVRDELREIEDEAAELRNASDDAFESLEYAIDRLSELA